MVIAYQTLGSAAQTVDREMNGVKREVSGSKDLIFMICQLSTYVSLPNDAEKMRFYSTQHRNGKQLSNSKTKTKSA